MVRLTDAIALHPFSRFCGIALVALLIAATASAQTSAEIADAERKVAQTSGDARFTALTDLAELVAQSDVGRALEVAQQALDLAATPEHKLQARALQAALHRNRGDYGVALELARTGLAEAVALKSEHLAARFHYILARTQWNLADFPASTESFHEAIRLAEKVDDLRLLCDAHTGISTIYHDLNQPDQATDHLEKARELAEKLNDSRRLGDYYKILGNQKAARGDVAGARQVHLRSREIHEKSGNQRGVADALQNLAALAATPAELQTAATDCARAIAIYDHLGLPRQRLNAEREFGRVLVKLGRPVEAVVHLENSLAIARTIGGRNVTANTYRELANAYESSGNLRAAIDALKKFQAETDVILSENTRQRIAVLNARYEADRREHDIKMLRRDQELKDAELVRARWQRYGLIAILLLGTIAVGAFISRHRLKLRSEQRIHAETRAARDAAEQADAVKTRLLAMVSHDIRGPLGNVLALAADLRTESGSAKGDDRLLLIEHEAERVVRLAEELLDAAALEAGRLELQLAPLDLAEITTATLGRLRRMAAAKGQSLLFTPPSRDLGVLTGDAARLTQVVTNLVSNAIKYAPRHTTVQVTLTRESAFVRLQVRDEGPGIPPDEISLLFRPFSRLSAKPTGGESTHGVGLSITHDLVRLHGGRVFVESTPGQGATFTVELPL